MCKVPLVADATIASKGASHWNTANGLRPAAATTLDVETGGLRLLTPLRLSRLHPLLDHRRLATSEFAVLGGSAGQDSIQEEDFPNPPVGGRYLLVFVPGTVPGVRGYSEKTLILYDAFPVDSQGNVLLKSQTTEQGQVTQEQVTLAITQIESQLSAC
jgi:hypothetical protein